MGTEDPGAPEAPEELCDICYVPLDAGRTWVCVLGEGCCPDCFAKCEAAGRCAMLQDDAVWEKIEHLRRSVRDRAYSEEHK